MVSSSTDQPDPLNPSGPSAEDAATVGLTDDPRLLHPDPAELRGTAEGPMGRADPNAPPATSNGSAAELDARPPSSDLGGHLITVPWHSDDSGPIPTADGPVTHRWRKVAGRTLSKAWGDSLFGMSSQAAFWTAMSTAPFLLALLGLSSIFTRWLFGPGGMTAIREQASTFLNTIFNKEVAENLIGNTIDTILNSDQTSVISVGLIISLWAGSSAMSAFVEAITIAYGQHEVRHPVAERFFALGLYIGALMAEIVALPLIAIGPEQLPRLFPDSWRPFVQVSLDYLYYPVLGVGLILLVTTLYKVAPKRKHAWSRGLPGAALAAAVFLVASTGLRLYLSYVYSHGLTYGALATPITFLLFYYFMSMAIIIGAQFNNALLEYYPPLASKKDFRAAKEEQSAELAKAG